MKIQAKYCTLQEIRALTYWRKHGYMIGIDENIPLSMFTPPSLATRKPITEALVGGLLVVATILLAGAWLGKAAGIY